MTHRLDENLHITVDDPATFDHAAHLRAAFETLRRASFLNAATAYSESLKTIAANAGEPDKFNITVTLAFLSVIAERMDNNPDADWLSFIARNEDLLDRQLLMRWYDKDRLWSDTARTTFLMPEKTPPQNVAIRT